MQEVRLVTPSMSLGEDDKKSIEKAKKYFEKLGYTLTEGKYIFDKDEYFGCSSIENRVEDLMEAFKDTNVKIILCGDGGYNVNQILPYLDYEVIEKNPKIIIGYSDFTALLLAINKKSNLITYYGPMLDGFSSNNEYTLSYFEKILDNKSFMVTSSKEIYDYRKVDNKREDVVIDNEGMKVVQEGSAFCRIVGGNLCTINLLQGTEYMPDINDCILFLEDDADDFGNDVFLLEFDRNLESLLQTCNYNIKGIVFGRFQLCSNMTLEKLEMIIKNKKKLRDIPVVFGVDFGHTNPMFTIPIGSNCKLDVIGDEISIEIQ